MTAHFPASGQDFFTRLRNASVFYDRADVREDPIHGTGSIATGTFGTLEAHQLDHGVDAFGYRLVEPDGRRMVPELLRHHDVAGPMIGQLQIAGIVEFDGRTVRLTESVSRDPGSDSPS